MPTRVGALRESTSPVPSWPYAFDPQAHSDPSALMPRECDPEAFTVPVVCSLHALTDNQSPADPTGYGTSRFWVSPTPSWPPWLAPHAQSEPSDLMAKE